MAAPQPIPAQVNLVLQATSFLKVEYYTNIKGLDKGNAPNGKDYFTLTSDVLDPNLANIQTSNVLPFINSVKLDKKMFSKLPRAQLIKTLFSPDLLKSYVKKALEKSFFSKGSKFNPKIAPGGDVNIVKHNIKLYLDLLFPAKLFSKGISIRLANNDYEINNVEWDNAPSATANVNLRERSGNNTWLASAKRGSNNKVYKIYSIVIFLDLEPGKATNYSKLNSRCDARRNKIREIAYKQPVTKKIIEVLYGPNARFKRKVTKKKGHSIKAPRLYGTNKPLRRTSLPPGYYSNYNRNYMPYRPRYGGKSRKNYKRKLKQKNKTKRKKK